jgi:hypothetical protein
MIGNLQELVIQLVSRFFHERGMEPAIDYKEGVLEVEKPEDMNDEEFGMVLTEMTEHVRCNTERYCGG